VTARDGSLGFYVPGIPTTQGSKKAFVVSPRGGKPRAVVTEQLGAALSSWRETVRSVARAAAGDDWLPLDGPVAAVLAFGLAKPRSAPKTRRTWPIGKNSGDLDKLTRAVFDALTQALIWDDDSRVVDLHVTKDYAPQMARQGVTVVVRPLVQAHPPLLTLPTQGVHQ
jgi:Holliday junction resolvase RusA-like endonuclease